jgi:hypothetical protein
MVFEMELVAKLLESLLKNVDQTQKKQKRTYATKKGRIMFQSFRDREISVKMRK